MCCFSCFEMFLLRRRVLQHYGNFQRFIGSNVQPKEVQVPVPWGHIAVKQWGELSQPLVVCCHGFLDNAGTFDRIIPLLPKKFCYLAMDYPGHGFSSPGSNGLFYTDDLYTEAMYRLQRYFGNEKIGLIGHSMGAALSLKYIVHYAGQTSFVVAMDLPTFPSNCMFERIKHAGRRMDKIMRQFAVKDKESAKTLEEFARAMVVGWGGSIDLAAAEILLKRGAKPFEDKFKLTRQLPCGNNQVWGHHEDVITMFDQTPQDLSYCGIEFLQGIRFYTPRILENTLQHLAKSYKRVEHHAIRGKHHLVLTHPQLVSKIITEFIDRVQQQ